MRCSKGGLMALCLTLPQPRQVGLLEKLGRPFSAAGHSLQKHRHAPGRAAAGVVGCGVRAERWRMSSSNNSLSESSAPGALFGGMPTAGQRRVAGCEQQKLQGRDTSRYHGESSARAAAGEHGGGATIAECLEYQTQRRDPGGRLAWELKMATDLSQNGYGIC